jgi:hypothetical protein
MAFMFKFTKHQYMKDFWWDGFQQNTQQDGRTPCCCQRSEGGKFFRHLSTKYFQNAIVHLSHKWRHCESKVIVNYYTFIHMAR